ncbi:MAG: hypothetical protein PWQ59_304 [Thermoanaerobacterium sp.]|nr:hypothetical protein [Thermoanaerobacterium sp.]MDN5316853.1 hypothetical protein [Thermoanaerobacterium sp.]
MKSFGDMSLEMLVSFTNNFLPYPKENMTFWFTLYIIYFAPKLLTFFIMGDFFYEDFRICSVYVFTRKDNRSLWFINKLFKLMWYILAYYASITAVISIVGIIKGFNVDSVGSFLLIFAATVVLNVITTLIFALLANILSLYANAEMSMVFTLFIFAVFHIPAFVWLGNFQNLIIKLDPALQTVLVWHDDSFLAKYNSLFNMSTISGFNVWWSLFILGVYLILAAFTGIKVIRMIEITDKY